MEALLPRQSFRKQHLLQKREMNLHMNRTRANVDVTHYFLKGPQQSSRDQDPLQRMSWKMKGIGTKVNLSYLSLKMPQKSFGSQQLLQMTELDLKIRRTMAKELSHQSLKVPQQSFRNQ